MKHYLDAGNQDRLYGVGGDCSDLLQEDFDYDRASARVLGRDLGRLLTHDSRQVVERVLAGATDQAMGALAMPMVRNNANFHGDPDMALKMLVALREGIREV